VYISNAAAYGVFIMVPQRISALQKTKTETQVKASIDLLRNCCGILNCWENWSLL